MHRTTIMLPDELKILVQALARERKISLSEFIRTTLEQAVQKTSLDSSTDPLFMDHAVYEGKTPSDLASHHDDYLYGDSKP
jgi:predicted transcriptional regulator